MSGDLKYAPEIGTIVICDFRGMEVPEMTKRRPCVVLGPRFRSRQQLCTLVPFSTSKPKKIESYHFKLSFEDPLPEPYSSPVQWVKCDMVYTLAINRMRLPLISSAGSKREYDIRVISKSNMDAIKLCVLHGIGINHLTEL